MRTLLLAFRLVFTDKKYAVIGIASALTFGAVFIMSSGMVRRFPEGLYVEWQPLRLGTLVALSILAGLVVPLQWYAFRKAKARVARDGVSSIGGMLTGIATMSCCAPLLLPAFLSLVGFSGTQLLLLNISVRRYALPLSLTSVALLAISLALVSRSVVSGCRLLQKNGRAL